MILIGAEDDWTPASRCTAMHSLAEIGNVSTDLELEVYPDTRTISFDLPMQRAPTISRVHERRASTRYPRETQGVIGTAQVRMLAFFAKHLGGPYPATASAEVDAAGHSGFGNILRAAFAMND